MRDRNAVSTKTLPSPTVKARSTGQKQVNATKESDQSLSNSAQLYQLDATSQRDADASNNDNIQVAEGAQLEPNRESQSHADRHTRPPTTAREPKQSNDQQKPIAKDHSSVAAIDVVQEQDPGKAPDTTVLAAADLHAGTDYQAIKQSLAGPIDLLMPEPPSGPTRAERKRLGEVKDNASNNAESQQSLPSSSDSVQASRASVDQPKEETEGLAQAELLAKMRAQTAPSPAILALCVRIKMDIFLRRPTDEDTLENADPKAEADAVGDQLKSNVKTEAEGVDDNYQAVNNAVTPKPGFEGTELDKPPTTVAAPEINARSAAPDKPKAENLSLEADVAANQERMEQAGMTGPVADAVLTGPIADARAAQGQLVETAARDPEEVMAELEAERVAAGEKMKATQLAALNTMLASREKSVGEVGNKQESMVKTEEQKRKDASAKAQKIVTEARTSVNTKISTVVSNATKKWDTSIKVITQDFEDNLTIVKNRLRERHNSTIKKVWDYVTGIPDWAVRAYDRAERKFVKDVCALLKEVSIDVNLVVKFCEEEIRLSHEQVAEVYKDLPESLRDWATQEQEKFDKELNALKQTVYDARDGFNKKLTSNAKGAVITAREKVQALREKAKGFFQKAVEAIAEFVEDPVKGIINGLLAAAQIEPAAFWALINQIEQVITDIANDPLKFARNLASALSQGFSNFAAKFSKHLKSSFFAWLFNMVGAAGIELPTRFDPASVFKFILDVLGISWEKIKKILKRKMGAKNAALFEKAEQYLGALISQGPEALLDAIKEKLDPKSLFAMLKEKVFDYLLKELGEKIAIKIIPLFSPATGVIAAIHSIYKVLSWVFENAADLAALVKTVIDGASDLVAGKVAGMAATIEEVLARLMTKVIDFLADFIGLDGIPKLIQGIIDNIQEKVEQILERIIDRIIKVAGKMLRPKGKKVGRPGAKPDKDPKKTAEEAENTTQPMKDTELGETQKFSADGENHRIWIEHNGRNATLMMASTPTPIDKQISEWERRIDDVEFGIDDDKEKAKRRKDALAALKAAKKQSKSIDKLSDKMTKEWTDYMSGRTKGNNPPPDDNLIEKQERDLVPILRKLLRLFGERAEASGPKQSKIVHRPGTLDGDEVGMEMVAEPLVKNHPQGSKPSGQDHLMSFLTTNPSFSGNQKFIQGHLLNHNIGGVGKPKNLYPITAQANKDHSGQVEEEVKKWVGRGQTVSYKVAVAKQGFDFSHDRNSLDARKNYVNADFKVKASAQAKGQHKAENINTTIKSRYTVPSEKRYIDVLTSSGQKEEFNLRTIVQSAARRNIAINKLKTLNGIGDLEANNIYDRFRVTKSNPTAKKITDYKQQVGIDKKELFKKNPDFIITQ